MATPTPKSDQLRQLREQAYAARLAAPNYDATRQRLAKQEKLLTARKAVINSVINEPDATLSTSAAQRQAKWRQANPELHRERSRESMRKRRANEKANG